MLDIREIPLGPYLTKYHFQQPGIPAMHHMRAADPDGDYHDHPFSMTSFVLFGSYIEDVLDVETGETQRRWHGRNDTWAIPEFGFPASDSFLIGADHVHRIVELPEGECWTITLPHAWEQEWSLYQKRDDGIYKRFHNQDEWVKL